MCPLPPRRPTSSSQAPATLEMGPARLTSSATPTRLTSFGSWGKAASSSSPKTVCASRDPCQQPFAHVCTCHLPASSRTQASVSPVCHWAAASIAALLHVCSAALSAGALSNSPLAFSRSSARMQSGPFGPSSSSPSVGRRLARAAGPLPQCFEPAPQQHDGHDRAIRGRDAKLRWLEHCPSACIFFTNECRIHHIGQCITLGNAPQLSCWGLAPLCCGP